MNTSGGFLLEPSQGDAGPSRARQDAVNTEEEEEGSVNARKLSAKQEVRLMNYLDEEFLQINRGFNKRHNSKTSTVPRLDSYLQAFGAILEVIASIPPIGPSASLLVSYLLRLTSDLLDGIIGYEVTKQTSQVTHSDEDGGDEEREDGISRDVPLLTEQLQQVIQSLSLLDKVWSCVLRGQLIDVKAAKSNVLQDFTESDDYFPMSKDNGNDSNGAVEEGHSNAREGHVPGRYPSKSNKGHHLKEARSIIGSKGFASVAQTDRIRLRNVIILGKENLFAWMRVQLNVPLPPPQIGVDEAEERDVETVEEAIDKGNRGVVDGSEGNGEEDLEEVDTDRKRDDGGKVDVAREAGGDSHFDDLFARKIDPDASDSESDTGTNDPDKDNEEPVPKRVKRDERSESRQASTAPIDVESVATFSNTATVMRWDIKFARLFANTLRCLSDIQEYRNQRDAAAQRGAKGREDD